MRLAWDDDARCGALYPVGDVWWLATVQDKGGYAAMRTYRTLNDLTPAARALLKDVLAESARDELAADPDATIRSEKETFRNLTADERCHLELAAAGDPGARRAIRAVFALPLERGSVR